MDIKKQYFDLVKTRTAAAYVSQKEKMQKVAAMFGQCMDNGGVVQLFGFHHCEEFVNELNYRAGGIAPYHGLKFRDMMLMGYVKQEDIDSGAIMNDTSVVGLFGKAYKLDPRDLYVIVSFDGTEPLCVALARKMKEEGHKLVAVVNKVSYDKNNGSLLEYCDEYIDMTAEDPDVAFEIGGYKVGQVSSTVTNIIAQMLTAELYDWYVSNGKEAPVLLSANVKGADVHNNSLTDPYEGRVR